MLQRCRSFTRTFPKRYGPTTRLWRRTANAFISNFMQKFTVMKLPLSIGYRFVKAIKLEGRLRWCIQNFKIQNHVAI